MTVVDGNANYKIYGDDMQFIEIELEESESIVAEAGAMMFMDAKIKMETMFGDGSKEETDLKSKLFSAGKRMLTGESLFMTQFTNVSRVPQKVSFAAPYPGKVIVLNLSEYDGQIICQRGAFLCAEKGTALEIAFQKNIGVGLFGGEGFIMQRLMGSRRVFLHCGGTIIKKELEVGEMLKLDTGCLVAMTKTVHYDIEFAKGITTALFGGEGLTLATLTGPGTVWLQSLPFNRLVNTVFKTKQGKSGGAKEEGSILKGIGIGNLLGKS